jgi:hypothetical protein
MATCAPTGGLFLNNGRNGRVQQNVRGTWFHENFISGTVVREPSPEVCRQSRLKTIVTSARSETQKASDARTTPTASIPVRPVQSC